MSICKFFESQNDYYLIMNYISDTNMSQFIKKCHFYIKNGHLELKYYKRITRYLFWQLVVIVHVCTLYFVSYIEISDCLSFKYVYNCYTVSTQWLHNDMHCCHLDLSTDNILIAGTPIF